MPYRPRDVLSNAATGELGDEASAVNPGGGSYTLSRWLIQHVCSCGRPANRRPGSRTVSSERPNSPASASSTRPPGEDQAEGLAPEDLLERRVVGQQLREDAALAHPPSDELRVLAAEVEHEHLLGGGSTRGRGRACVRCPARRALRRGGALGACARSHPDLLRGGSRGPGRRGLGHPCRKLPAGAPFGSAATATSGGPPTGTSSRSAAGDSAEPSPGSSSEASGPSCEGRLGGAAIAARVAPMPIDCSRWSTLPSV